MEGRLGRLMDSIYLEANGDKDSFYVGGFTREGEKYRNEQEQEDYDQAVDFLNSPHGWDNVDKDTFLELCARIYDQKEIEYVDKDNIAGLGITDKQVRRFLAHKSRAKQEV
jgi:hypothetical protein